MFTFADTLEVLGVVERCGADGSRPAPERMEAELSSVQSMTATQVKEMFPSVTFSDSDSVVYFPFKMCHSLPKRNARGRGFTPHVLHNSFASAVDSLVNFDHHLVDNGIGAESDIIIGHIKAAIFDSSKAGIEIANAKAIPKEPIPLFGLGAIYLRHSSVPGMIQNHLKKKETWLTSMECGHKWSESCFLYEGEFIPLKDAEQGMLQCVGKNQVKPYKGKELTVCLGGLNSTVDFWGLGMTTQPADGDAEILAMIAASSMELASQKKFFMPLRFERTPIVRDEARKINPDDRRKAMELAHINVDKSINEMANLTILGETQPAEDGHTHQVLSDLTIVPSNGHTHYSSTMNISRGTNPRLTGRTDTKCESYRDERDVYHEKVHLHLFDIALKGKATPVNGSLAPEEELANLSKEEAMSFLKTLQEVREAVGKLSTGNSANGGGNATEIASLTTKIDGLLQGEALKKAVEDGINEQITSGKLVKREVADAEKTTALQEAEAKAKAELEAVEKRQARLTELQGLGVALDYIYDETLLGSDGKPLTIKGRIETIGFDANGESEYKRERVMLSTMFSASKTAAEEKAAKETLEAAAANKGKEQAGANDNSIKSLKTLLAVGSGPALGAGAGTGKDTANTGAKKIGRHAVSA